MPTITIHASPSLPTVAELVAADYRKAHVFSAFGIDFCCGGKKPVAQICEEKNVDFNALQQALALVDAQPEGSGIHWNFQSWDTRFLIDFIVNAHHAYVREQLPKLLAYGEKVARVHGHAQPETVQIDALVRQLADELLQHMVKEEKVLFPWIKNRAAGNAGGFANVEEPVRVMEDEHETAGNLLREIRTLSADYTPPVWACNTYRVWYASLHAFETDLHLHVHLENNVLFPRALALCAE